jgi:hypothetical protein
MPVGDCVVAMWANSFCLGPVSKAFRGIDAAWSRGCAGGCARSIRRQARELHVSLASTSINGWGSSV